MKNSSLGEFLSRKLRFAGEIEEMNQQLEEMEQGEDRDALFLQRERKSKIFSEMNIDKIPIEEFRKEQPLQMDLLFEELMSKGLEGVLLYILYKKGGEIPYGLNFDPAVGEFDYNWVMVPGSIFDLCCEIKNHDPEYLRQAIRVAETLSVKQLTNKIKTMRSDSNRKVYPYLEDEGGFEE